MTRDEQQLVVNAVREDWNRTEAVGLMLAAGLVTEKYAAWYGEQTPARQSAEWAPGGFLLLQARRAEQMAKLDEQFLGGVAGMFGPLASPFTALWSWIRNAALWVIGGALVILLVVVLTLRR